MNDWLDRTRLLLGEEKLARLERAHVLVVGLGGVGAYAAEQLCRAGIGEMTVIDGDVVEPTNKNRQLLALDGNMGLPKAEVMASRLRSINPALRLHVLDEFVRDDRMLSNISDLPQPPVGPARCQFHGFWRQARPFENPGCRHFQELQLRFGSHAPQAPPQIGSVQRGESRLLPRSHRPFGGRPR